MTISLAYEKMTGRSVVSLRKPQNLTKRKVAVYKPEKLAVCLARDANSYQNKTTTARSLLQFKEIGVKFIVDGQLEFVLKI